jgi:hypothetical protein
LRHNADIIQENWPSNQAPDRNPALSGPSQTLSSFKPSSISIPPANFNEAKDDGDILAPLSEAQEARDRQRASTSFWTA